MISVNTLNISQPEVKLLLTDSKDSIDSISNTSTGGIKELLISLNHSRINSISIEKGMLIVESELGGVKRRVGNAENFHLKVQNFELDSSQHDHPFKVEEVKIGFENAEFDLSPTYYMKLAQFSFSYQDSTLYAENFQLIPKLTVKQFAERYPYKKNRMDVNISSLICSAVNFDKLLFQEKIEIGKFDVLDGNAHISKDHTKAWPSRKRFSNPIELLQNAPIATVIQELNIKNTTLISEQIMPGNEANSILAINDMNVSLYNLANDSAALIANSVMRLELNLKLMGTAFLSVNGTFNLIDEHQNYALNARMKSTPLQLFNPLLKSAIHVEIASGQLNEALIALKGNKYQITGTTELNYSNATIAFEQKDAGFLSKLKKNMISGLANTLLKTNNIKGKSNYKIGQVYYPYDHSVPFVRSIWLAIQIGIIDTMIPFDINRSSSSKTTGKRSAKSTQTSVRKHKRKKRSN